MSELLILKHLFQRCSPLLWTFYGPRFLRKLAREPVDAGFSWKIGVKLEISVPGW